MIPKSFWKVLTWAATACSCAACASQGGSVKPAIPADKAVEAKVEQVLKGMTLEEKAGLCSGADFWHTKAIERLGIPSVVLSDGPAGLRINPKREGDENTYYCTHFPIGTLLACTWNQELVENVGKAMGNEVLEYGADVLLAPALNIHRNPLNGRNFEYYSEDPVVAGKTAAAYVRGIQSNGVGTSIKHFAYNNQETNRMNNNAIISPRAQREIYLKGFEIAVKESDPWTVMSSYNRINGTYTSESKDLQTTVLRDDWGYGGVVMTDWYGGDDGAAQMRSGNDMLQPGTGKQYNQILAAIADGTLPMEDLDRNVKRILEMVVKTPVFKGYPYSNKPDLEAHAAVTRQSALEGMVLLENNGVLPLGEDVKKVAVFGETSFDFIAGGTGSGNVNRAYTVSLIDGLKNGGYEVDETLAPIYEKHMADAHEAYLRRLEDASEWERLFASFLPEPRAAELVPTAVQLKAAVAANDIALITLGRISGEFLDRTSADFNLSVEEHRLISEVTRAFHAAGKKVVVVLNVGGVVETASWKRIPDAVLLAWQAGQEGGNSVTDILSGKASPSGKLTMTFPLGLMDAASSANFPIDKAPKMNLLQKEEGGTEKDVDYTVYEEGVYVGYRWFDKAGLEVSYPFGYGLSYTTFSYSDVSASVENGTATVRVRVENTGDRSGKEVVQVYASVPGSDVVKELKAYGKTGTLAPGASETLTLSFAVSDLASYDETQHAWVLPEGTCKLLVAASSRDIRSTVSIDVPSCRIPTSDVLHLQ